MQTSSSEPGVFMPTCNDFDGSQEHQSFIRLLPATAGGYFQPTTLYNDFPTTGDWGVLHNLPSTSCSLEDNPLSTNDGYYNACQNLDRGPLNSNYLVQEYTSRPSLSNPLMGYDAFAQNELLATMASFPSNPIFDSGTVSATLQIPDASKPYSCFVCARSFAKKGDMKRHSKGYGPPLFHCPKPACKFQIKGFSRKDKFDSHMKAHLRASDSAQGHLSFPSVQQPRSCHLPSNSHFV